MHCRFGTLLPALLAWLCLASPWLVCFSDCRRGALLPVGHDCHPEAHVCCGVDGEEHDAAETTDATESGGGPRAAAAHDHGGHLGLVFQQTRPDPPREIAPAPIALAWPPDVFVLPVRDDVPRPRSWSVDPPGFRSPVRLQLETDVLLL